MKRSRLFITMAALFLTVTMILTQCNTEKPYHRYEGFKWGTTFHITYSSNVNLDDSIMRVMDRVDQELSPFNPTSQLSRINRGETDSTSAMFRKVFDRSQMINRMSAGAFDPTLGPIIDLWGFGPSGLQASVPDAARIDSARAYVGIMECSIDSTGILNKKAPETRFDFSAIAKGMGCDMVADLLNRNGVANYIVEIGGEVVIKGNSPRKAPWRIMVDAPIGQNDTVVHDGVAVINMTGGAVATSGDYRNNHIMDDGSKATHIIDPATGAPAHSEILSVTVLAPDCMTADAFATACSVMPLDSARAMISRIDGIEALFVTADTTNNSWILTATEGFPQLMR